jgi:glycosyltransferase involved in cell wall biosynthesis
LDHETGLLFDPNDPQDLAEQVRWAWTHPDAMTAMGRQARLRAQNDFSPARNYDMLMDIYRSVVVN